MCGRLRGLGKAALVFGFSASSLRLAPNKSTAPMTAGAIELRHPDIIDIRMEDWDQRWFGRRELFSCICFHSDSIRSRTSCGIGFEGAAVAGCCIIMISLFVALHHHGKAST